MKFQPIASYWSWHPAASRYRRSLRERTSYCHRSFRCMSFCSGNGGGAQACAHRELIKVCPESSPRLNGHFELLVGPALLDLRPKFERATGNTSSAGWAPSKMTAPECFLFFKGTRGGHVRPRRVAGQFPARTDEMTCSHWDSAPGSLGSSKQLDVIRTPRSSRYCRIPHDATRCPSAAKDRRRQSECKHR